MGEIKAFYIRPDETLVEGLRRFKKEVVKDSGVVFTENFIRQVAGDISDEELSAVMDELGVKKQ